MRGHPLVVRGPLGEDGETREAPETMIRVLMIGGGEARFTRLEQAMRPAGYEATYVESGAEGLALARRGGFKLILLDMLLPDMQGTEVCRQLKRAQGTRDSSVIVVTELDTEIDRIVAFELGAVDYVTDPFSVRELLLRLRVALARMGGNDRRAQVSSSVLTLDLEARRAMVHEREVELSPRELDLLAALYARRGVVQSRTELRDAVWGDSAVSLRTVDASVKRLRHKLGQARIAIETVRGIGYRYRELETDSPSNDVEPSSLGAGACSSSRISPG
jgi:two-component system phosphate regulon response regulator PhoB